jgi:hypothetical protein
MRKLFLFTSLLGAAFIFNGCSSNDDDNDKSTAVTPTGTVSFTLNGEKKTYNTIEISEVDVFEEGNENYIMVTARGEGSRGYVRFTIPENEKAAEQAFYYHEDTIEYESYFLTFSVDVKNNNKAEGTFQGTVSAMPDGDLPVVMEIKGGTFSINY